MLLFSWERFVTSALTNQAESGAEKKFLSDWYTNTHEIAED
jgi:hypothetical protein